MLYDFFLRRVWMTSHCLHFSVQSHNLLQYILMTLFVRLWMHTCALFIYVTDREWEMPPPPCIVSGT